MKKSLFLLLLVQGLVASAQESRPYFEDFYRDRLRRARVGEDQPAASWLDTGEKTRLELGLDLTNDIAQNLIKKHTPPEGEDTAWDTHAYRARCRWIGERGILTFSLIGRLATDEFEDTSTVPSRTRTSAVETIDLQASHRTATDSRGWSRQYWGTLGYVGNEYHDIFISPWAQQNWAHKNGAGDVKHYEEGNVSDFCLKVGGALSHQIESPESRWYCSVAGRLECAVPLELDTNGWEQSNVGADLLGGVALIRSDDFAVAPPLAAEVFGTTTRRILERDRAFTEGETVIGARLTARYRLLGLSMTTFLEAFKPLERFADIPIADQYVPTKGDHELHLVLGGSFTF